MSAKVWLEAARLRTLPLSISGILVGSFYAYKQYSDHHNYWIIFSLAFLTTLGLQVLSNFANDYGDGVKGTDNKDRVGPQRALQSGAITPEQMKKGIIIVSVATLMIAVSLIYASFGSDNFGFSLFFFVLGLAAITAAIKYTVGKSAYGYRGLGDLFVFIFFGLVSVLGTNFLFEQSLDIKLLLPAVSVGLLSVAVLNLNNMRDRESDSKAGKNTLVVKIGAENAKRYHITIVVSAMLLGLIFAFWSGFEWKQYLFVLAYIPLLKHLKTVITNQDPKALDPELKKVALSTFLFSVLLSVVLTF